MNKNQGFVFWIGYLGALATSIGVCAGIVFGLTSIFGLTFNLPLVVLTALVYGLLMQLMFEVANSLGAGSSAKVDDAMKENKKVYKELDNDDDDEK